MFKVPSEKRRTSLASVACAVVGVLGFGAIWSLPKYEKNHHLPSTTNIGKEFCFTPDAAHHEDGVTQPYKAQIEVCVQDLQTTGPITVFDNPRDVNAELIATWFRSNNTGEFTAASNVEEDLGASPDADVTQIRQVIKAAYLKGYIRAGEANAVRLVLPLSGNFPVFKNVLTDYSIIKVPETKNSPTDITITPVLTP